ncbi:hypothetical protein L4C33_13520 [Vibrio makurazakiensis]|uniref:hypothetical protein n=1 Tax=Vibrio makurazakiensis TaxID=2910250 RepID=UPI003D0A8E6F
MRKLLVAVSIVITAVLFYFNQPDRTEFDNTKLAIPACELGEQPIMTRVSYFVDLSLSQSFKPSLAQQQVDLSNLILGNSCLPLRRELSSFEYTNFKLSGEEYFDDIYSLGSNAVGSDVLKPIRENPLDFYVFVVPNHHWVFEDGTTGITDRELNNSYILLADDASLDTLEHEFGHLMWANHSETLLFSLLQGNLERATRPESRHLVKPYARAYSCSNAGTVMSYEDIRLPIYSSPSIQYRSESCGNKLNADNRRRVLEYIDTLREQTSSDRSAN